MAPLDIPAKLARFLEAQGIARHAEAAALLLDSRQPPADRARQALSLIADRRYVFVLDNFESLMEIAPPQSPPISGGRPGGGGDAASLPFYASVTSTWNQTPNLIYFPIDVTVGDTVLLAVIRAIYRSTGEPNTRAE